MRANIYNSGNSTSGIFVLLSLLAFGLAASESASPYKEYTNQPRMSDSSTNYGHARGIQPSYKIQGMQQPRWPRRPPRARTSSWQRTRASTLPVIRCQLVKRHKHFLIIGHSGGNPRLNCENTLEATRSGLESGANSIEVDLTISKDGIIFLWHDQDPLGLHSLARRLGFALSGKCRPSMHSNSHARDLTWHQIKTLWYYVDLGGNFRSTETIPTLDEWLQEFSTDARIELMWFDLKIGGAKGEIRKFVKSVANLLAKFKISAAKVQFSTQKADVGLELQQELITAGLADFAENIVVDTVALSPMILMPESYDGISTALSMNSLSESGKVCGCCSNIGKPPIATNAESGLEKIVKFNVAERDRHKMISGSHLRIYVWTIDDRDQMEWLARSGIDGIITNKPEVLAEIVRRTHATLN